MKLIAHSEVPKDPGYFHLGYISAAAYNKSIDIIGSVVFAVLSIGAIAAAIYAVIKLKYKRKK
jgi:predicted acylesterase/phospholipase RssA